jgi:CO dehydrogenase/acetyl-CoA synthase alpha subunit
MKSETKIINGDAQLTVQIDREVLETSMNNKNKQPPKPRELSKKETEPDWSRKCEICGQSPIVPCTGMCGPCTFGEAETMGGNW